MVLRVVPGIAPRPLLIDGVAPIRHNNTTHPANWQQLAALFTESDTLLQADPWTIVRPTSHMTAQATKISTWT